MSVPVQDTVFSYIANGSTDTFAYQCYVLLEADLQVYLNDVLQTSGYTVTGLGNQAGGTVIFGADPVGGTSVVLMRSLPLKRDIDYAPLGDLRSDTVDEDIDRVWMAIQDKSRDFFRSIRYRPSESLDGELPNATSRANKLLGFDANGFQTMVPLPASVGAGDLRDDTFVQGVDFTGGVTVQLTMSRAPGSQANVSVHFDGVYQGLDQWSVAGDKLNFSAPIPAGITRVYVRTGTTLSITIPPIGSVIDAMVAQGSGLYNRIHDMVSVTDFGAKGDNITEDFPAFTAAAASVNGPVFVPPNRNYKLAGGSNNFKYGLGYYDVQSAADDPSTTIQITRKISSVGSTASQTGGFIVYNDVEAGAAHHEFGMFSVLNNYATATTNEPVAFYAQANSLGAGASPLWAGVMEVGNIRPNGDKSTASSVLAGIEVDVNNWFAFDAALKKLGVVCIARGGGECNEAFTARGEGVPPGGGFFSGYWRVGFWIQGGGLNPTQGTGLLVDSDHDSGVSITGKSNSFGVNIAGTAGSSAGLRVGPNYSTAIIVPTNRKILMNDVGNPQGISYVSASSALTFDAAALGLSNHTTFVSASAGGAGAPPGSIAGYIGVVINGTPARIPFYNA